FLHLPSGVQDARANGVLAAGDRYEAGVIEAGVVLHKEGGEALDQLLAGDRILRVIQKFGDGLVVAGLKHMILRWALSRASRGALSEGHYLRLSGTDVNRLAQRK